MKMEKIEGRTMKNTIKILIGLALAVVGSQAQAYAITDATFDITPTTIDGTPCDTTAPDITCWQSDVKSALNATDVATIVGYSGILEQYYKMDVEPLEESGEFANHYKTTFDVNSTDLSDALIGWLGGSSIACPECYLVVKGGGGTPSQYLFDIGNWNGTDDIFLSGFWGPDLQGSISHIAIYGKAGQVPEPGMVALLSIGLIGMVVARLRMKL